MSTPQILQNIPDVIWSGIIASILTLSGVLISNWSNTKRLRIQLAHDSNEKSKERTSAMRRQVYLGATEELIKIGAILSSLPNRDLNEEIINSEWAKFQSASAQVQLIANPETAALASKVSGMYSWLFLELAEKLIPIGMAKADIKISDNLYKQAESEIQRILKEMANINDNPETNTKSFSVLRRRFDFQQEQAIAYSKNTQDGWKRFNKLNIEFQKIVILRIKDIAPYTLDLLDLIRKDLSLQGDYSVYRRISVEQIQVAEDRLQQYYEQMEKQIEQACSKDDD